MSMFKITITIENDHDLEAIKDVLEEAAENGVIENAFDLKVDEIPEGWDPNWSSRTMRAK